MLFCNRKIIFDHFCYRYCSACMFQNTSFVFINTKNCSKIWLCLRNRGTETSGKKRKNALRCWLFYLSVSPARRAPHPNQATIGFTTLSVTLTGDRNPSRKGKDVTALRCSEPLCYKVGGASKPCAILCGMGPPYYNLLLVFAILCGLGPPGVGSL